MPDMPFYCHIDHQAGLVTADAQGDVSTQDLQNCIADIIAAKAMAYRKLFDVSAARVIDPARVGEAAATVRLYAAKEFGPVGPVAVVIAPGVDSPVARLFVSNAPANRPVRFFEDAAGARAWLDSLI